MCGIIGYVGNQEAVPVLLAGLEKLSYRGYDSAGIAVLDGGASIHVVKAAGKLENLLRKLKEGYPRGSLGVGHTRWATHGAPTDYNAHPHTDCGGLVAVVHNGIIENYAALRSWLEKEGHIFSSETDTEVLPHLLEHFYRGDLLKAVLEIAKLLRGSYAFVAFTNREPGRLVAARQDSPLVIGEGEEGNLLASDIPALLAHTRKVQVLENGEVADLGAKEVEVYDSQGRNSKKRVFFVDWEAAAASKGEYPHFMYKEICEQPRAIRETLIGRVDFARGTVDLREEISLAPDSFESVHLVACGTAYHAGLVGRNIFEKLLRVPVNAELASEFRYRDPVLGEKALVLVISQSGETADTLAALREAKARGAKVLAITNVVGSSVAREADEVLYTRAGPEVAVASTKAYTTQLVALYLLGIYFAQKRGKIGEETVREMVAALRALPEKVAQVLEKKEELKAWGEMLRDHQSVFFIGRGFDWATALEGALKLKEISYLHAEAYAAGELKHGTLALITEGVPVIALATQEALYEKMASNMKEVKARGGVIWGFSFPGAPVREACDYLFSLPPVPSFFAPVLAVVPLQLLAYFAACARGCDVDQPRNLAKSVTVE